MYEALSYEALQVLDGVMLSHLDVGDLKLSVYEALSYQCMRP